MRYRDRKHIVEQDDAKDCDPPQSVQLRDAALCCRKELVLRIGIGCYTFDGDCRQTIYLLETPNTILGILRARYRAELEGICAVRDKKLCVPWEMQPCTMVVHPVSSQMGTCIE